jgi:hypothetical protein
MAGAVNYGRELSVRQFERPDVLMDTRGPFVDGQAIRGDCVPQSDKSERGDFDVRTFIVTFATWQDIHYENA